MGQFPAYSVPAVNGASVQLGGAPSTQVQPNDQRFCTYTDAKVILKAFTDAGVPDASILDASQATINGQHFTNVNPNSVARPYYITSSQIQGPVGPLLWMMYGANGINGGGRGNPGTWTGLLTGNPRWSPTAVPTVVTLPNSAPSSGDAASFAATQGVGQGGLTTVQDTRLSNIERLVIKMAASINIQ